jgi:hypothetical protein
MTTRFAKTATVMAATIGIIAVLLAYPALSTVYAQTATSSSTSSSASSSTLTGLGPCGNGPGPMGGGWNIGGPGFGQSFGRADVSVGQTITFTSTSGQYFVVGHRSENGTASGSVVFTVTGNLTQGFTLSISGKVVVGSTTYTISSGSGQMNPSASTISGQGATSSSGAFILQGTSRGSFVGSTATVSLDLQSGSTEYNVVLSGTV